MKIAISTSSFGSSNSKVTKLLEEHKIEVIYNPYKRKLTEEEVINHIGDADGLLAGLEPLTEKVFANSRNLKAVARVGVGVNNIDFASAKKHNIKVSNTPDGPTFAVAEMTVAALLALLRNLVPINKEMHEGKWPKQVNQSLAGKNVLIIGFGRIGRKFSELISPFNANIFAYDEEKIKIPPDIKRVSLEEGLGLADVISLHAAGDSIILGKNEFKKLKKGAIVLNSARGSLVDEMLLIEYLRNGTISGAWIDAFWKEPYNGELSSFDNVIMTPHLSTYTEACRSDMEMKAVQNILKDLGVL